MTSRTALKLGEMPEWVIFWLLVGGLAWTPYWYASNDLPAWGINAVLFPTLAVFYELLLVVRGRQHPVPAHAIGMSAALFASVVGWIVVQNATWTPTIWHHPIWSMAEDALKKTVEGSISVNRDATTLALVRLLTAASVFWAALQLGRNPQRASWFMRAIAVIICGYCAYGLIELAVLHSKITAGRSFVSSTFVNRVHFAAYAGVGLVIVCGHILKLYWREVAGEGGSLRVRLAMFLEHSGQRAALWVTSGFVIFVALLLAGSRGGIVASGVGIAALITLSLARREGRTGGHYIIGILLGVAVVAAILLTFGDAFFAQFTEKGVTDKNRFAVYMAVARSIWDAPLLGYGYGNFADVFPMFRDRSLSESGVWEQAHNTYLEVFQGLGLIFGLALILSVALLVAICFQGAAKRRDAMIPCVAISVAILLGAHSLVDFTLQIQAVTLTFMAILGVGVAQSQSSRSSRHDNNSYY